MGCYVSLFQQMLSCVRSGATPWKTSLVHLFRKCLDVDGHSFLLKLKVRTKKRPSENEAQFRPKALGDWSCDCWRWRDILGCHMVIGGSGFATSQRWKACTGGKRPSELRAVRWMYEDSQVRNPVWFSAPYFLLLLFKRKSSLFHLPSSCWGHMAVTG